jgi:hypothetical protein
MCLAEDILPSCGKILDALKWMDLCEMQKEARTRLRTIIYPAMLDKLRPVLREISGSDIFTPCPQSCIWASCHSLLPQSVRVFSRHHCFSRDWLAAFVQHVRPTHIRLRIVICRTFPHFMKPCEPLCADHPTPRIPCNLQ